MILFALIVWDLSRGPFGALGSDGRLWVRWVAALVTTVLFFASVLLHELSHSFVAKGRGFEVRRITLFIFGGVAQVEEEPDTPKDELLITLAGPAMSVLLALIFGGVYTLIRGYVGLTVVSMSVWHVAFINMLLAAFNMLPGFPLDGGRVARSLLWYAWGDRLRATRTAAFLGQLLGYALIALGVFVAIAARQLLFGLFNGGLGLLLATVARATYAREVLLHGLAETPVYQLAVAPQMWFPVGTPLSTATPNLLAYQPNGWAPVVSGRKPVGVLSAERARKISRNQWPYTTVEHVMDPLTEERVVRATDAASDAYEKMTKAGSSAVMVVDRWGDLTGLLTRSTLRAAVETEA